MRMPCTRSRCVPARTATPQPRLRFAPCCRAALPPAWRPTALSSCTPPESVTTSVAPGHQVRERHVVQRIDQMHRIDTRQHPDSPGPARWGWGAREDDVQIGSRGAGVADRREGLEHGRAEALAAVRGEQQEAASDGSRRGRRQHRLEVGLAVLEDPVQRVDARVAGDLRRRRSPSLSRFSARARWARSARRPALLPCDDSSLRERVRRSPVRRPAPHARPGSSRRRPRARPRSRSSYRLARPRGPDAFRAGCREGRAGPPMSWNRS